MGATAWIVVPAYQEAESIGSVLDDLTGWPVGAADIPARLSALDRDADIARFLGHTSTPLVLAGRRTE